MTPVGRRRLILVLVGAFAPLLLMLGGIAVALLTHLSALALAMFAAALAIQVTRNFLTRRLRRDVRAEAGPEWWFNRRTGEAEYGYPVGWLSHRDGPYASREDALRSREIAQERAEVWNAED